MGVSQKQWYYLGKWGVPIIRTRVFGGSIFGVPLLRATTKWVEALGIGSLSAHPIWGLGFT